MPEDGSARQRVFPDEFDETFPIGPEAGNNAFFGLNVLRGLVEGIDDFINERQPRWTRYRSLGPALLGSSMWIDDTELIDKIGELSSACIVVSKQGRKPKQVRKLERLAELNERTPGMPVDAFYAPTELAPKVDGKPMVVGPSYSPRFSEPIPTIRTLGFRKGRDNDSPPIIHAKLALLGHLWWHDEDGIGGVADVIGFEAKRLWISSANFTSSSRRSLEFGYRTEDRALVKGAERFLIKLMSSSEALDPDSDLDPELAPIDYDDMEMAEAWAEMRSAYGDWDDDG